MPNTPDMMPDCGIFGCHICVTAHVPIPPNGCKCTDYDTQTERTAETELVQGCLRGAKRIGTRTCRPCPCGDARASTAWHATEARMVAQGMPKLVQPAASSPPSGSSALRSSDLSSNEVAIMMEDGRRANQDGDFAEAERIFSVCYRKSGLPEARISAANMKLKMGRVDEALRDYKAIQRAPGQIGMHSRTIVLQKATEAKALIAQRSACGTCRTVCDDLGEGVYVAFLRVVEAMRRCGCARAPASSKRSSGGGAFSSISERQFSSEVMVKASSRAVSGPGAIQERAKADGDEAFLV